MNIEGAVVESITVDSTHEVYLNLKDGRKVHLELFGDCCSGSYFTDTKQFDELIGATIQEVEERWGKSDNNLPEPDGDDIKWHFLVFTTNKGHITIDWHNDSNGYYDGTLNMNVLPASVSSKTDGT